VDHAHAACSLVAALAQKFGEEDLRLADPHAVEIGLGLDGDLAAAHALYILLLQPRPDEQLLSLPLPLSDACSLGCRGLRGRFGSLRQSRAGLRAPPVHRRALVFQRTHVAGGIAKECRVLFRHGTPLAQNGSS
jgi:hypothetical protein